MTLKMKILKTLHSPKKCNSMWPCWYWPSSITSYQLPFGSNDGMTSYTFNIYSLNVSFFFSVLQLCYLHVWLHSFTKLTINNTIQPIEVEIWTIVVKFISCYHPIHGLLTRTKNFTLTRNCSSQQEYNLSCA